MRVLVGVLFGIIGVLLVLGGYSPYVDIIGAVCMGVAVALPLTNLK